MNSKTKSIHCGRDDENAEVRSVSPTLIRASTILFKDHATWQKYRELRKTQRVLNYNTRGIATNFELERLIHELEGGHRAQLLPTGLTTLAVVLLNYASRDAHFLITGAIYGPVRTTCDLFLEKMGVGVNFLEAGANDVEEKIKLSTRLILCESSGSILYEIINLPEPCKIAHSHSIPAAIDNIYPSGHFLSPLELGVGISVIAATRYLSEHSDVIMGMIVINKEEWKNFDRLLEVLGLTTSPNDAYLVFRGIRTLDMRMKAHKKSADEVVEFLQTGKESKTVLYPKLKSHPSHDIFGRDHKGANGMIAVEFVEGCTKDDVIKPVDLLQFFSIGASWGDYESLATVATPPRTATSWSARGPFVRFHMGLEDLKGLVVDLTQAFNGIKK